MFEIFIPQSTPQLGSSDSMTENLKWYESYPGSNLAGHIF